MAPHVRRSRTRRSPPSSDDQRAPLAQRTIRLVENVTQQELYYDPYDFAIDEDPYPIFARLREEAPLYRNERYDFYAVSRYADVERCSLDWKSFMSGRGTLLEMIRSGMEMPRGMFIFEDPPIHNLHRRLMGKVFSPRRVAELEVTIREYCCAALDPLVGQSELDFVRDLGAEMPMRVISRLLGIPESDQVKVRDHMDRVLSIEEGTPASDFEAGTDAMSASQFEEYIAYRRQHPSDDLMTDLMETTFVDENGVERHLDHEEVVNYAVLLAAAGIETTTKLIGWSGYLLGIHPEQRRLLLEDPALIPGAIEEVLRFEPPSPVQARYVAAETELHGTNVPEGSVLLLLTASANRDERQFDHAETFDVTRPVERHMTFGHGLHICMGAALARLEGRVALEEMLARFPNWEVDLGRAERVHTSTVRGWHRLPVLVP
jgi:cytochrome P450